MGNQSVAYELELEGVAKAIGSDGYAVGAVRINQAIAEIHRLEDAELAIRAYCKKAQSDGFQHVPIKTILELLSNR